MDRTYSDKNVKVLDDRGIRLGDQLEETGRLIDILAEKLKGLEDRIGGILRFDPLEAEGSERGSDVDSSLAPLQHQVMAQYMQLNTLCAQVDSITRRVQL